MKQQKKHTTAKITWLCIILLILYFLFSCSPTQRLARLHEKHPAIFQTASDTVIHTDTITVTVPSVEVDTIVLYETLKDTITIQKNGLKATMWSVNDTVYLKAKTDTITMLVPYEVKIPVTKYIVPEKQRKIQTWFLLIILVVAYTIWKLLQIFYIK